MIFFEILYTRFFRFCYFLYTVVYIWLPKFKLCKKRGKEERRQKEIIGKKKRKIRNTIERLNDVKKESEKKKDDGKKSQQKKRRGKEEIRQKEITAKKMKEKKKYDERNREEEKMEWQIWNI